MSQSQNVYPRYGYRIGFGFEVNTIYKALELIGLYDLHQELGPDEEFADYYNQHTESPRFYYRNHGIDVIYDLIDNHDHISKKSIRRTGILYSTVRIYEGTDEILNAIYTYLESKPFLHNFYTNYVHKNEPEVYLTFQYDVMHKYCMVKRNSTTKWMAPMQDKLIALIGKKNGK